MFLERKDKIKCQTNQRLPKILEKKSASVPTDDPGGKVRQTLTSYLSYKPRSGLKGNPRKLLFRSRRQKNVKGGSNFFCTGKVGTQKSLLKSQGLSPTDCDYIGIYILIQLP